MGQQVCAGAVSGNRNDMTLSDPSRALIEVDEETMMEVEKISIERDSLLKEKEELEKKLLEFEDLIEKGSAKISTLGDEKKQLSLQLEEVNKKFGEASRNLMKMENEMPRMREELLKKMNEMVSNSLKEELSRRREELEFEKKMQLEKIEERRKEIMKREQMEKLRELEDEFDQKLKVERKEDMKKLLQEEMRIHDTYEKVLVKEKEKYDSLKSVLRNSLPSIMSILPDLDVEDNQNENDYGVLRFVDLDLKKHIGWGVTAACFEVEVPVRKKGSQRITRELKVAKFYRKDPGTSVLFSKETKKMEHKNIVKIEHPDPDMIVTDEDSRTLVDMDTKALFGRFEEFDNGIILMKRYQYTLESILNCRKKNDDYLSILEICYIMKGLLSGLKYLKENGICHRDLHDENIALDLTDQYSRIVIIDFGYALFFQQRKNQNNNKSMKVSTKDSDWDDFLECHDKNSFRNNLGGIKEHLPPEIAKFNKKTDKVLDYSDCDMYAAGKILEKLFLHYKKPSRGLSLKEEIEKGLEYLYKSMIAHQSLRLTDFGEAIEKVEDMIGKLKAEDSINMGTTLPKSITPNQAEEEDEGEVEENEGEEEEEGVADECECNQKYIGLVIAHERIVDERNVLRKEKENQTDVKLRLEDRIRSLEGEMSSVNKKHETNVENLEELYKNLLKKKEAEWKRKEEDLRSEKKDLMRTSESDKKASRKRSEHLDRVVKRLKDENSRLKKSLEKTREEEESEDLEYKRDQREDTNSTKSNIVGLDNLDKMLDKY